MHRSCFAVIVACLLAACLSESAPMVGLPPADLPDEEVKHQARAGEYIIAESSWPAYGVPGDVNHYPSYQERTIGLWINIARIGYMWYRNSYLAQITPDGSWSAIFDGSDGDIYSSGAPGFWNFNLNRAARGHCTDVRANSDYFSNGGGHNDANGTSASTRVGRFSSCYGGEVYINQSPEQGIYSAMTSVGSWICDGYHYLSSLPSLTKCSRDNGLHTDGSQGQNGHRKGVMNSAIQFGCGVDAGTQSSSTTTTTCDFCKSATTKYSSKHIAAGSHVGDVNNTNPMKFLYMATIAISGITVSSVKVIEETPGTSNTITLTKMFQGPKGAIYGSPSYPLHEQCRTYYFQLTYGSTTERYPETGYFYTYGMNCNEDWKSTKLSAQCTSGVCCNTTIKMYKPATAICRASVGGCDFDEYCTGSSTSCPADTVREKGYVCEKTRGVCESDGVCDGKSGVCPGRKYKANRTLCRNSTGPCDAGGFCNGTGYTCPSNEKRPEGYVCNASSGPCENDAVCTGTSSYCPSKRAKAKSTQCRNPTGPCDIGGLCDGKNITCPKSQLRAQGYVCSKASGPCENDAVCSGSSDACPAKTMKPTNVTCRSSAGACDIAETCDGKHASCPDDQKRPKGYVCNAARGVCENDGVCNGVNVTCSARTYKENRTLCRESSNGCDAGGFCTGSSYTCPSSEKRPQGYVCNASTGPCDIESVCSGSSLSCPAKKFKPKTTLCRAAVGLCDYDEYCTGNTSECPPNKYKPAGTVCNRTYNCTVEDSVGSTQETTCNESYECTGKSGYCPFEEPVPSSNNLESANRVGFSLIIVAIVSMIMLM